MKRKLLILSFLVSFQLGFTQSLSLITDLDSESPSCNASFVEFNNIIYFNANSLSSTTGKIYSIDANNNVQLELELNSPIYNLTPHDGGINYNFMGINQTLFKL